MQFCHPCYLFPKEKGATPFRIYALDGMVGLYPPAPNGYTMTIFALYTFTKWPEYNTIMSLESYHTSMFVHHKLVCCYAMGCRISSGSVEGQSSRGSLSATVNSWAQRGAP